MPVFANNEFEESFLTCASITDPDPDQDPLTYFITTSPLNAGISIDSHMGVISWTPTQVPQAPVGVSIEVQDGRGGSDTYAFQITVVQSATNWAPRIISTAPHEASFNLLYRYPVRAIDADADPLTFDLPVHPDGMLIDAGVIAWKLLPSQVGSADVLVRVQNGHGGIDLQSYTVTVGPPNTPPNITSKPIEREILGNDYYYQVLAQDADHDHLTFSLLKAAPGMEIDYASGAVVWQNAGPLGDYPIEVRVTDGRGGRDLQNFTLHIVPVEPENGPPEIDLTHPPRQTAQLGTRYLYQVVATDPDHDPLTFSLESNGHPDGMAISDTGLITWTPTPSQLGTHDVHVRVSDNHGNADNLLYNLTVVPSQSNRAPEITSHPVQAAVIGKLYSYDAVATDPDGDILVWSLDEAPWGMSIDGVRGTIRWTPDAA